MKKSGWLGLIFVGFIMVLGAFTGLWAVEKPTALFEYANNPVYGQHQNNDRAYYPCVIGFKDHYKMWYDNGSGAVWMLTSGDGLAWAQLTPVTGLNAPRHPAVVYDREWGYKIYYWDGGTNGLSTRTADSTDGIFWVNDRPITQDAVQYLVGGEYGSWWYHHYGPAQVIYNAYAKNTGANPWDYSFVMTFDTASEKTGPGMGIEHGGLAYSSTGDHWFRYGATPILRAENNGTWDDDYAYHGIMARQGNQWRMWYCGANYEAGGDYYAQGIGEAYSNDGLTWTKFPDPVLHRDDNVPWRNLRTYTPWVIKEGHLYKLWFTGKSDNRYSIGYAQSGKYKKEID